MNKIRNYIIALTVGVFGAALAAPAASVAAYNPLDAACSGQSQSEVCQNRDEELEPIVGVVVNTLLYIVGALAVVMVIFSGIMYTISGGDSGRVAKAKNMLTYSIVGLVIAFLAFALVNWVFDLFG